MKKEIKTKNRIGVLDKEALKEAVATTMAEMKKIHKKIYDGAVYDYHGNPKGIPTVFLKETRYDTCGWAWMVFGKVKNKQLFDLFEAYGSKVPDDEIDIDNKRVLYHLTRSDVPPAENLDDDASEYMISMGISETSAMRDWKQQHFEVRFDFKDDGGNDFYDQSQLFKEEVYTFLLTQLKPFGLDAEIKTMAD